MKAFLYGVAIQFKLDIRSKTMLITCYVVPLIFFAFMSGIFMSIDPNISKTLIPSMSVFVITMSALIGLPPSLSEVYSKDIKKVYKANGVPLCLGVITQFISTFVHTFIVSIIIFIIAPLAFKAQLPSNIPLFFCVLTILMAVTLAVGCIIGLLCNTESKTIMIAMIIFLPSIMLSGIMFPSAMLPEFMQYIAYAFPATIGFKAFTSFQLWHVLTLTGIFIALCVVIAVILRQKGKQ